MPLPASIARQPRGSFAPLDERAYLSLITTAAFVEHAFIQLLRPHGLTPTQFLVLKVLHEAGDEGLSRKEISERLARRVPDVTRLVDRLEHMRLAVRSRSGDDRRQVRTRLSTRGRLLWTRIDRVVAAFYRRRFGTFDPRALRVLIAGLEQVRASNEVAVAAHRARGR